MDYRKLETIACQIRQTIVEAVYHAGSGHPGGSLSATDILTALYFQEMKVDPENPAWEDRDRFVLSKGHGAPALYATLAQRGFFPREEVMTLRKLGSRFQGHPNCRKVPGVEMSTGSLGQGMGVAIGMALAGKLDQKSSRVFTLLGDGELQEGIIWEAAMAAAHYRLDNLVAILDHNGLQIDGRNEDVMTVMPVEEKFRGFGWEVLTCDGHDMKALCEALETAGKTKGKPTLIIAETIKGKGVSFMENQVGWHGVAPDEEQYKQAMKELGGEPA